MTNNETQLIVDGRKLRDAKKMKSEKIKLNAYLQRNNNKGDGGG
jgi:hypothetical protein